MKNIYDPEFPLQIRQTDKGCTMVIHETGKEDIEVEIPERLLPALNALREIIAK